MVNGVSNIPGIARATEATPGVPAGKAGATNFADVLKNSIDEVTRLQQDASRAVEDLAAGRRDDVAGVMTAMEKSDLAFKTLLAIRAKLMDAYEEIKSVQL